MLKSFAISAAALTITGVVATASEAAQFKFEPITLFRDADPTSTDTVIISGGFFGTNINGDGALLSGAGPNGVETEITSLELDFSFSDGSTLEFDLTPDPNEWLAFHTLEDGVFGFPTDTTVVNFVAQDPDFFLGFSSQFIPGQLTAASLDFQPSGETSVVYGAQGTALEATAVPEPLTVLGTAAATGLGVVLKKQAQRQ